MRMPIRTAPAALALASALSAAQAAAPQPGEDLVEWCAFRGGTIVPQPADSPIAACCTPDGCIICAPDWTDCSFDPPYSVQGAQVTDPGAGGTPPQPGRIAPASPLLNIR